MAKLLNKEYLNSFTRCEAYYFLMQKGESVYGPYGSEPIHTALREEVVVVDDVTIRDGYIISATPLLRGVFNARGAKIGSYYSPEKHYAMVHICESRGAEMVCMPGGCAPVSEDGYGLIDAFVSSGTSYYKVPMSAIEEFVNLGWLRETCAPVEEFPLENY